MDDLFGQFLFVGRFVWPDFRLCIFFQNLVHGNKLADKIIVIPGKVEEVDIPEKVGKSQRKLQVR